MAELAKDPGNTAEDRRQRAVQCGRNLMDAYNEWRGRHDVAGRAVMGSLTPTGSYQFLIENSGHPCIITVAPWEG